VATTGVAIALQQQRLGLRLKNAGNSRLACKLQECCGAFKCAIRLEAPLYPGCAGRSAIPVQARPFAGNAGGLLIQALEVAQLYACLKTSSLPTVFNVTDVNRLTGMAFHADLLEKTA
jgi:hypothetical protein